MFEYKIPKVYEECVIDMSKMCEKELEMERLTHERSNGIKSGYWSPDKKQDLVNRLAEYENTDLTPQQIKDMQFCLREKSRECADLRRELQELKERDTAKTPVEFDGHWYKCPRCGKYSGGLKGNFCHMCGQRLKWED